jgi:hypothetical protein
MRQSPWVVVLSIAAAILVAYAFLGESSWRPAVLGLGIVAVIAAGYFAAEGAMAYRRRHPRDRVELIDDEEEEEP